MRPRRKYFGQRYNPPKSHTNPPKQKNNLIMSKSRKKQKGKLTVIAGPMFSGKTSKLVALVEVFTRMGHRVMIIKPRLDNRFGNTEEIISHDKKRTQALVIDSDKPELVIQNIFADGADKIIFDEVQFFDKEKIKNLVRELKKSGKHVIVAGLMYDYRRVPFGATPDLMGLADESLELVSICQKCGSLAKHSQRVKGTKKQVDVGAANKYIAVCESCHRIYR
jgi:thymidine kinase